MGEAVIPSEGIRQGKARKEVFFWSRNLMPSYFICLLLSKQEMCFFVRQICLFSCEISFAACLQCSGYVSLRVRTTFWVTVCPSTCCFNEDGQRLKILMFGLLESDRSSLDFFLRDAKRDGDTL